MPEPATSSAGGIAAWKIGTSLLGVGIVTSALGFMVLWPKTAHEALVRLLATMAGAVLLGPLTCILAYYQWPQIFAAAMKLCEQLGMEPWAGLFMVGAPLCAFSGLPFWWLLGAIVLWFENRKGKDLGELAVDAKADVAKVLP